MNMPRHSQISQGRAYHNKDPRTLHQLCIYFLGLPNDSDWHISTLPACASLPPAHPLSAGLPCQASRSTRGLRVCPMRVCGTLTAATCCSGWTTMRSADREWGSQCLSCTHPYLSCLITMLVTHVYLGSHMFLYVLPSVPLIPCIW